MRKAKNNSEKSDYQKFAERTQSLAKKLDDIFKKARETAHLKCARENWQLFRDTLRNAQIDSFRVLLSEKIDFDALDQNSRDLFCNYIAPRIGQCDEFLDIVLHKKL